LLPLTDAAAVRPTDRALPGARSSSVPVVGVAATRVHVLVGKERRRRLIGVANTIVPLRRVWSRKAVDRRRLARIVGVATLIVSAVALVVNALTIRDRASAIGEASAASGLATISWFAAAFCVAVLVGAALRRCSGERPRLLFLWVAGATVILLAYLVFMATATLWV
jgi:hypothetical protein